MLCNDTANFSIITFDFQACPVNAFCHSITHTVIIHGFAGGLSDLPGAGLGFNCHSVVDFGRFLFYASLHFPYEAGDINVTGMPIECADHVIGSILHPVIQFWLGFLHTLANTRENPLTDFFFGTFGRGSNA